MKKILFPLFLLILTIIIIISSCDELPPDNGEGSLSLNLLSDVKSTIIQPDVEMVISTYDITGYGPNEATFSLTDITESSVGIGTLTPGEWVITVKAKNSNGIIIADGEAEVTIISNKQITTTITIRPLSGNGTLDLTITWEMTVINPIIEGTLTPVGGTSMSLTFDISASTSTGTYLNSSLEAGYYTLCFYLKDGPTDIYGAMVTVRILAGETSTGVCNIDDSGNIEFIINPDLQNPIEITLSGQQESLALGSNMTITATTSEPVDSYQWFLNAGFLMGQTNSSITIGDALSQGTYRLDLIVNKGVILSSTGISFTVNSE